MLHGILFCFYRAIEYSPFCVPAKVTKLIGLKRPPFLSPTNLIIFACTQNGEFNLMAFYAVCFENNDETR